MIFPDLPAFIIAPDGRHVPIIIVEIPSSMEGDDGVFTHASYNRVLDCIEINQDTDLETQWHSLYHEQFHCWMWKTGLTYLLNDEKLEDLICQAFATAAMNQWRQDSARGDRESD